ncbi:PhoH family protein [Candidatus Sumerlaeota bacterium]|nr:PhoH family protein [Candidatus Sumerlaeales bacterium]NLD61151.1 PhoH family protein [Candidatus Sumerlaeota bacterium]
MVQEEIILETAEVRELGAQGEARLRELENQFGVRFVLRGNVLKVLGEQLSVSNARQGLDTLLSIMRSGNTSLDARAFDVITNSLGDTETSNLKSMFNSDRLYFPSRRKTISPMTRGQKAYLDAIRNNDVVFGIGVAGTGKTYLAMAMAVYYLMNNWVRRIILVRPAVEAGEKLGFLPGDIASKFDPYVRPLYDALHDMVDSTRVQQFLEGGVVEIAPLAFMRGRTLNASFIILDEAQNTTIEQMKMFLTRMGYESKVVVTGDITQIDLPVGKMSGLQHVSKILHDVEGVEFVHFDHADVVRHPLVRRIVSAYDKWDEQRTTGTAGRVARPEPTNHFTPEV